MDGNDPAGLSHRDERDARRYVRGHPAIASARAPGYNHSEHRSSYRREDGTLSAWSDRKTGSAVGRKSRKALRGSRDEARTNQKVRKDRIMRAPSGTVRSRIMAGL